MTLLYDRLRAVVPTLPDNIPIIDASTIQQRIDLLPDDLPQATAADYGTVAVPFDLDKCATCGHL